MIDTRPDPDELRDKIRVSEERAARGKLKIFFGASADVGKAYAMHRAARQQHPQGVAARRTGQAPARMGFPADERGGEQLRRYVAGLQAVRCGDGAYSRADSKDLRADQLRGLSGRQEAG